MGADASITLPSDWLDQAKGYVYQADTADVNVSVTPTSLGDSGSQTVTIRASGLNAFGSPINRNVVTLKVEWNGIECATYQPDARIKRSGGSFKGNDVYNLTGAGQTVALTPPAGSKRLVYMLIENDGDTADSFSLETTGAEPVGYELRYFRSRTDEELTTAINANTFVTPVLQPGKHFRIRIRVSTTGAANVGETLTRLFTFTSVNDGSKQDAAKLTVTRD
jgi:hypothetical protein